MKGVKLSPARRLCINIGTHEIAVGLLIVGYAAITIFGPDCSTRGTGTPILMPGVSCAIVIARVDTDGDKKLFLE